MNIMAYEIRENGREPLESQYFSADTIAKHPILTHSEDFRLFLTTPDEELDKVSYEHKNRHVLKYL